MKKLIILPVLILFIFQNQNASAQIINDTLIFFQLYERSDVRPSFKSTVRSLNKQLAMTDLNSRNFSLTDSLLYLLPQFETAVLKGQDKGIFNRRLVGRALKLYPGKDAKAIRQRLLLYKK